MEIKINFSVKNDGNTLSCSEIMTSWRVKIISDVGGKKNYFFKLKKRM